MKKLTFEGLKELFETFGEDSNGMNASEFVDGFFHHYNFDDSSYQELLTEYEDDSARLEVIKSIGPWKLMDEFGGEGEGDDYWSVFYFELHDIYIEFNGWYASYNGAEFSEMYQVYPKEVTKTEYVRNLN